ncbi:MAG: zinc metalloprotease HtpX [Chromatiaceae bacterium]|nr:zinc metalloprotease HtpX [Chromatiaceae bacterium]
MNRERLLAHKFRNNLQSTILVLMLSFLCAYLAGLIGGAPFAWAAMIGVVVLYFTNPAVSPRLVMNLYRGRPLVPDEAPRLYAILRELCRRAGLDWMPVLYYVPTRVLNAFTTGGRTDAAIALSDGLLRQMELRELAAVLAHEVSHIANGDVRVMAFADLVSRITGLLSFAGQFLFFISIPLWLISDLEVPWIAILILMAAPTLSAMVQLALSRSREYEADRSAAELTGEPEVLATALQKLAYNQPGSWEQLFLPGRRIPDPSLLRTHPPTAERVRRLLELRERERLPQILSNSLYREPRSSLDILTDRSPLRPRWHISGLWY